MGKRWREIGAGVVLAGLAAFPVAAQDAAPKEAPKEAPAPPFRGRVTAMNVNIRMAPGRDGTIVRVAREGESVLVVGAEKGWFQIAAPENAWCWLSASAIKKTPEGEAVVKKDAPLRGDSRNNAPVLGTLAAGTPVKVLSEKPDWLKIQAPPTVGYWISDDYVAFERAYDPAADGEILVGKGAAEKPKEKPEDAAPPPPPPADPQAELRELKAKYEDIERRYKDKVREATAPPPAKPSFLAEGWLDSLGLFLGRPGTHELKKGGRTVCYLRSGRADLDLNAFYGKYVGVNGKSEAATGYEPLQVITVESVETLAQ